MTKQFMVHISKYKNNFKPKDTFIGTISKEIVTSRTEATVEELMAFVEEGRTICPGIVLEGTTRTDKNIESVQVVMLDYDEGITLEEAQNNPFVKEHAAFIYPTFSHKPSAPRLRIVFILERPLSLGTPEATRKAYKVLYKDLSDKIGVAPDASNATPTKMIYGTNKKCIPINMENRVPYDESWETNSINSFEAAKEERNQFISTVELTGIQNEVAQAFVTYNKTKLYNIFGDRFSATRMAYFDVIDYLKSINIGEVFDLPVGSNFEDIFHEESKPSARIYCNDDVYYYTCFSDSSSFKGNLIDMVAILLDATYDYAIQFLVDVFDVTEAPTKEQKKIWRQIDALIYLLEHPVECKQNYPGIYDRLAMRAKFRYRLINFLSLLRRRVFYDKENKIVRVGIYMSKAGIANYLSINSHQTINDFTKKVRALGVVTNVKDEDIPEYLRTWLRNKQLNGKRNKRVNLLEIPLNDNYIDELEMNCLIAKQNRDTNLSNEVSPMKLNKGEAFVKEVFVQGEESKEDSERFRENVKAVVTAVNRALSRSNYVTYKKISSELKKMFSRKKVKPFTQSEIKSIRLMIQEQCHCTEKSATKLIISEVGAEKDKDVKINTLLLIKH